MYKAYVTISVIFFVFGCYAAYAYTPSVSVLVGVSVLVVTVLCFLRRIRKVVIVSVCMLALALGALRIAVMHRSVDLPVGKNKTVEGVVIGDVETGRSYDRYTVRVEKIDEEIMSGDVSVLVYEPYPTICVPGEEVTFSGYLREPENFLGSGGRIFHYKRYLSQLGIHAITFIEESSCKGEKSHNAFFAGVRSYLVSAMETVLTSREASLLSGLILGLRGSLPSDLLDAFRITGLIHIIVLSGYNVTLVAETIRRLFSWTPRKVSFLLSLTTIVLFVLLAGAQTAAVRAGSMAVIALIAKTAHREYDGVRALMLVAVMMILHNPDQVLFSISFHLSFLATLGLLLFSPLCERVFRVLPQRFEIRGIVSATIATQIFLLPYLAYAIGEVSVVGILANILVLPIIPVAMLFGFMVTVVAVIVPFLAVVIAPIAYLPLRVIIFLSEYLAIVPGATVSLPEIPATLVVLITALLIFIGYESRKCVRKEDDVLE